MAEKKKIELRTPNYSNLHTEKKKIKEKISKYKSYIQETQKISNNSLSTRFNI